jgi:NTP pyrophosphatase (non-canonical NTP hydrolase)
MSGLTISQLVATAHGMAVEKGWHEVTDEVTEVTPDRFGALVALVHSEASEALEAYRETGKATESTLSPKGKPEGVPSELADIVIRVADICGLLGIDLEAAVKSKIAYNATRPRRHGGKAL